jgi:hypothetical protein
MFEVVVAFLNKAIGSSLVLSLVVFIGGVCLGVLLSNLKLNVGSKLKELSSKKSKIVFHGNLKNSIATEKMTPVKLMHRIAGSFLKKAETPLPDPTVLVDYLECGESARTELYAILGYTLPGNANARRGSSNITWQHVYSNSVTQFWVSSATSHGIKLRGESYAAASPCAVMNWILHQDVVTGIDGLGGKTEIISRTARENEIIIIRKYYCKSGSGSIMSSKRDFKLVTCITMLTDGSYVIATRSAPWDFELSSSVSSSSSAAGGGSSGKSDLTKGYIRGIVNVSGYLLRPALGGSRGTDIVGCDFSFGSHVDMKGSRSGRGNTANVNLILSSVLRTIKCIQNGEADHFNELEGQSLQDMDLSGKMGGAYNYESSGQYVRGPPVELEGGDATHGAGADGGGVGGGDGGRGRRGMEGQHAGVALSPLPSPSAALAGGGGGGTSLFNATVPSTDDKYRLLSVSRDAVNRLRSLYYDSVGSDTCGELASRHRTTVAGGVVEMKRETFYEQNGIVLKELIKDYNLAFGIFVASFTVQVGTPSWCIKCRVFLFLVYCFL